MAVIHGQGDGEDGGEVHVKRCLQERNGGNWMTQVQEKLSRMP